MLFQKLRKNTRGILIVIAIAFGASLFYTGAMAIMDRQRGKQEIAANSIALVNGEPISWAAFQENVYANLRYQEMMGARVNPLLVEAVKYSTIESLINQTLLMQEAKKQKIKVSRKEIDAKLNAIKENFSSPKEFQEQLRSSGLTEAQLRGYLKEQIQAESDLCGRGKCSFFNQCPVFINRRLAETADLIIANHHLLLADIAIRQVVGWQEQVVLPPYSHVVVDEAHHIEDIATEYFGVQLSLLRIRRLMGFLYRPHGKNRGVLATLRPKASLDPMEAVGDEIATVLDWQLLPQLRIVDDASATFFQALETDCLAAHSDMETVPIPYGGLETPLILECYDRFHSALVTLKSQLDKLASLLEPDQGEMLALARKRVEAVIADLEFLMNADDRSYVYWVKKQTKQQGRCLLQSAPIHVGTQLREHLLFQVKSAIFTSATLSVNQSFDYFCDSIGLNGGEQWEIASAIFESPFDYQNQVYLAVAKGMPSPERPEFAAALVEHLEPILDLTQGRAFVLFTSYSMLQQTLEQMKKRELDRRFLILVQGEMPRTEMLEHFRAKAGAVLLGTDSFWEGVDVAGDALSVVVITKLPFKVPTEPIVAARSEQLQAKGINPFMHYFLPQAVLKFRQGCGRLIRTKTDRGLILVCDRRIMERNYGKFFVQSLPRCPIHYQSLNEIERGLQEWY